MSEATGTTGTTGTADAELVYESAGRTRWLVLAVMVPVVVVGAILIGRALRADDVTTGLQVSDASGEVAYDYEYVIGPGTGDRIAAGEPVEIVPAELVVRVGESIRIVNDDDQDHYVGVFFVAAGETLTQRFGSPGVLEDLCTVHPSGSFRLRVVEA